ncbi:hypothetical protein E0Z06_12050 [Rheinheimera sp. D18]|uniref:pilus assembly protein n=1 Tax=Rheinheimera sp. D18 TaxID=2545632 RepID=UPI00105361DC|nr:PilC/PilY family type IV pilus protein [Rheinheimera sp. D18]QBL10199.1 hypothetical protein E0Z06_12050 [Rheinheimera sp. D18]
MKSLLSGKFSCVLLCSALGMAIGEAAANTISIADNPLQTATGLPPNILFVIDDSGSMRWGFTPDSLVGELEKYSWDPRYFTEVCKGAGSYAGANNTCYYDMTGKRYLASSAQNKSYFNPNEKYDRPRKADGSVMDEVSFKAAPINGYDPSSGTINLETNYRAIMDDFYYQAAFNNSWRTGFTISPNGKAGHAFYYTYNSSCTHGIYDDRCYDYKKVSDTEKQKFANWFAFYRTRIQTSKWAIGEAFAHEKLKPEMRVGYGALNHSGLVKTDVTEFSGTGRSGFYNSLYSQGASGGTPLRTALDAAGKYFQQNKPWRDNPSDEDSKIRTCRQSFTILMTDGYYNDDYSGVDNADKDDGPLIPGPGTETGQYKSSDPFKDEYSNTLADIAMHYWKNDLLPLVDNLVPVNDKEYNPAFWQNMTTFGVSLGIPTELYPSNPDAAFDAIKNKTEIKWPNPAARDSAKLDDLLHAAVNSRGGFFNASEAGEFAGKLAKALQQMNSGTGSASNLGGVSTSSQTGAKIFQGRYKGDDWSGDLWTYDADNGMKIAWKASEGIPSHDVRNIKYFKGTTLSDFKATEVTTTELALTTTAEINNKEKLVNYLRGDQSSEIGKTNGVFRTRSSLLGDIAHSAPLYVGAAERKNYHRNGWPESASYLAHIEANKARKGVVYVGTNDGMLHAFSDNANLGAGAGKELFAYVPKAVLPRLKHLADPDYQHQYYVDGVLAAGDAYVDIGGTGAKWKTLVLGTLGRGAAGSTNSIFALDATNPAEITPLWEVSHPELGQNTGKVLIARANDGKWIGIIGYGYNNSTNKGGILVFNLATGATIKKIALPTSSAAPNGFAQLESWDMDLDGNVDYVYAGDYQGNIWKFDISKSNTSQWGLANSNSPIFTAKIGTEPQPITSGISISREPSTGKTWVMFGTGSYLSVTDKTSTSKQTIYGFVDETGENNTAITLTRSNLKARTYQESGDYRALESSTALQSAEKGWYIDLGAGGERVVLPPLMIDNVLVINTLKPDDDPCLAGGISWRMAIDPYKGGRLKRNFFNTANFSNGVPTSGVKTAAPTVGYTVIKTEDKDGKPIYTEVSGQGDASTPPSRPINVVALGRRLTWRELTNE